MKTNSQWVELFRPASGVYVWQSAYAAVVTEAKAILAELPDGATLSSPELVEKIFPEAQARGAGVEVRAHLFHVLRGLVKRHSFDGWIDTSRTKRQYGKLRAVFQWHNNKSRPVAREVTCPVCDHKFSLDIE